MYKIQAKNKNGWQDVRDFGKKSRPIIFFNSEEEANRWRFRKLLR